MRTVNWNGMSQARCCSPGFLSVPSHRRSAETYGALLVGIRLHVLTVKSLRHRFYPRDKRILLVHLDQARGPERSKCDARVCSGESIRDCAPHGPVRGLYEGAFWVLSVSFRAVLLYMLCCAVPCSGCVGAFGILCPTRRCCSLCSAALVIVFVFAISKLKTVATCGMPSCGCTPQRSITTVVQPSHRHRVLLLVVIDIVDHHPPNPRSCSRSCTLADETFFFTVAFESEQCVPTSLGSRGPPVRVHGVVRPGLLGCTF